MKRLDGRPHGSPHDFQWVSEWISPEPNTGCWLWSGSWNKGGYGSIGSTPRMNAHRLVWILLGNHIDDDFDLDHLCRVRCCVNPDHMEPVTRSVNLIRGVGPAILAARHGSLTHCPQGHPYEGENLYISPRGDRNCVICQRERTRQWRKDIAA